MKKLVCAVLAAGLLVSGAGAYRAPNVNVTYELPYCDEQINGDPQARAQMLYGLPVSDHRGRRGHPDRPAERGRELRQCAYPRLDRLDRCALCPRFYGI